MTHPNLSQIIAALQALETERIDGLAEILSRPQEVPQDTVPIVGPGYCMHCGRGDLSPSAQDWAQEVLNARMARKEAEALQERVQALEGVLTQVREEVLASVMRGQMPALWDLLDIVGYASEEQRKQFELAQAHMIDVCEEGCPVCAWEEERKRKPEIRERACKKCGRPEMDHMQWALGHLYVRGDEILDYAASVMLFSYDHTHRFLSHDDQYGIVPDDAVCTYEQCSTTYAQAKDADAERRGQ